MPPLNDEWETLTADASSEWEDVTPAPTPQGKIKYYNTPKGPANVTPEGMLEGKDFLLDPSKVQGITPVYETPGFIPQGTPTLKAPTNEVGRDGGYFSNLFTGMTEHAAMNFDQTANRDNLTSNVVRGLGADTPILQQQRIDATRRFNDMRPWQEAPDLGTALAEFLGAVGGTVGGSLVDPTSFVGGLGKTLLGTAVKSGGANAGQDALSQLFTMNDPTVYNPNSEQYNPNTQEFEQTGPTYVAPGFDPARVAISAVGGTVIPGAISGQLQDTIGSIIKQARELRMSRPRAPDAPEPTIEEEIAQAVTDPRVVAILRANNIAPDDPRLTQTLSSFGEGWTRGPNAPEADPNVSLLDALTSKLQPKQPPLEGGRAEARVFDEARAAEAAGDKPEISSAFDPRTGLPPKEELPSVIIPDIPGVRGTRVAGEPATTNPGQVEAVRQQKAAGQIDITPEQKQALMDAWGIVPETVETRRKAWNALAAEQARQAEADARGAMRVQDTSGSGVGRTPEGDEGVTLSSPASRPMDRGLADDNTGAYERTGKGVGLQDRAPVVPRDQSSSGRGDRPFRAADSSDGTRDQLRFDPVEYYKSGGDPNKAFRNEEVPLSRDFEEKARADYEQARKQSEEDLNAFWEYRKAQRERDAGQREQYNQRNERAQQQHGSAKGSNQPKGFDAEGRFEIDENGFVLSDKGGVITFRGPDRHKNASKWILKAQQESLDQNFERHNHPTERDAITVREFSRTAKSGSRGGTDSASSGNAGAKSAGSERADSAKPGAGEGSSSTSEGVSGERPAGGSGRGADSAREGAEDGAGESGPLGIEQRRVEKTSERRAAEDAAAANEKARAELKAAEEKLAEAKKAAAETAKDAKKATKATAEELRAHNEKMQAKLDAQKRNSAKLAELQKKADELSAQKEKLAKSEGTQSTQYRKLLDTIKRNERMRDDIMDAMAQTSREIDALKEQAPKAQAETKETGNPYADAEADIAKRKADIAASDAKLKELKAAADAADKKAKADFKSESKPDKGIPEGAKSDGPPKYEAPYGFGKRIKHLISLGDSSTAVKPLRDLIDFVKSELRRMSPNSEVWEVPIMKDSVSGGRAEGFFGDNVTRDDGATIDVLAFAIDGKNPVHAAAHETLHSVWKFFTKEERRVILKAYNSEGWLMKHKIPARYGVERYKVWEEESAAEAFASYYGEKITAGDLPGPVAQIYHRVRRLFEGIKDKVLTYLDESPFWRRELGLGKRKLTIEDVWGRVERGEVGRRTPKSDAMEPTPLEERARALESSGLQPIHGTFREYFGIDPRAPIADDLTSDGYPKAFGELDFMLTDKEKKAAVKNAPKFDVTPQMKSTLQSIREGLGRLKHNLRSSSTAASIYSNFEDMVRYATYSNRGIVRTMIDRYRGMGNEAVAAKIEQFYRKMYTDPGAGGKNGITTESWAEAVEPVVNKWTTQVGNILEPIAKLGDKELKTFSDNYQFGGKMSDEHKVIAARLKKAMNEFRDVMNKRLKAISDERIKNAKSPEERTRLQREAKDLQIGYVENYLPHLINVEKLLADEAGFLEAAAYEYRRQFGMSKEDADLAAREYYNNSIGVNFASHVGGNATADTLKGRVFTARRDSKLNAYYVENPVEALYSYMLKTTRSVAHMERFGVNNEVFDRALVEMAEKGLHANDRAYISGAFNSTVGNIKNQIPLGVEQFLGAARMYQSVRFLDQSTLSSLVEPISAAARSGNVMDAFKSMALTVRQLAKTKNSEDLRAFSEALGITISAFSDSQMANKFVGGDLALRWQRRMSQKFFSTIGLHQLTQAQRQATTQLAQYAVSKWLRNYATGYAKESARLALADLGIEEKMVKPIMDMLQTEKGMPPLSTLMADTAEAKAYRTAIIRFVNETIMNPTGAERPGWANNSFGSILFGIASFQAAFTRNVLFRTAKQLGGTAGGVLRGEMGMADVYDRAIGPLIGLGLLSYSQGMLGYLRDLMYNPEQAAQRTDEQNAALMFSRAGMFGNADRLINAVYGAKYGQDPINVFVGPLLSTTFRDIGNIWGGMTDDRPDNNTKEWKGAKSGFEVVTPFITAGLISAASKGPLPVRAGLGLWMLSPWALGAPQTAVDFANTVAGERKTKQFRDDEEEDTGGRRGEERSGGRSGEGRSSFNMPSLVGSANASELPAPAKSPRKRKYVISRAADGSILAGSGNSVYSIRKDKDGRYQIEEQ